MKNEPVAWINRKGKNGEHGYLEWDKDDESEINTPLYTHPAELTDEEILDAIKKSDFPLAELSESAVRGMINFARAILRKAQE